MPSGVWYIEPKLDGMRAIWDGSRLRGRNGNEIVNPDSSPLPGTTIWPPQEHGRVVQTRLKRSAACINARTDILERDLATLRS
jgi:hypothetical protein